MNERPVTEEAQRRLDEYSKISGRVSHVLVSFLNQVDVPPISVMTLLADMLSLLGWEEEECDEEHGECSALSRLIPAGNELAELLNRHEISAKDAFTIFGRIIWGLALSIAEEEERRGEPAPNAEEFERECIDSLLQIKNKQRPGEIMVKVIRGDNEDDDGD